MTNVKPLQQPEQRTRALTFIGRTVTGIRWHQGDIVFDFDGPNDKSLVFDTKRTFDENGMRLDYEGTA